MLQKHGPHGEWIRAVHFPIDQSVAKTLRAAASYLDKNPLEFLYEISLNYSDQTDEVIFYLRGKGSQ